jgi:integrase/recombinase XerD
MSALRQAAEDYLRIRRALGFKMENAGRLLPQFLDYLESVGAETITTEHAVRWATLPSPANPVWWGLRLTAVRGFARYLQTIDPRAELPPTGVLPAAAGGRRPNPYIYSEADIVALMTAARRRRPRLAAATLQTLIGLLAVTGMRIGEAIRMDRSDLDLEHARLVVRNSKFGKSRQLPLHPTTIQALRGYLRRRDQLRPSPDTPALLITATGKRLDRHNVGRQFRQLRNQAGSGACRPCGPPGLGWWACPSEGRDRRRSVKHLIRTLVVRRVDSRRRRSRTAGSQMLERRRQVRPAQGAAVPPRTGQRAQDLGPAQTRTPTPPPPRLRRR